VQLPRETIYSTLFAKLQGIAGIRNFTRRPNQYANYAPEEMPALLMIQRQEIPHKAKKGVPTTWELHIEVLIYLNSGSDVANAVPATGINAIMDGLEATIEPDAVNEWAPHLGLNGVYTVKFEGPVQIIEGLEDQSEIVARIVIVAL